MSAKLEEVTESSERANTLFDNLTGDITVPEVPDFDGDEFKVSTDRDSVLYEDIQDIQITDVTERRLDGEGSFDEFMGALNTHLNFQLNKGRITGTQLAEIYVGVTPSVLENAVRFALQKDQAKWDAISAQMRARIVEIQATQALIELEKTKADAVKSFFDMNLTAAQYGLVKLQSATEKVNRESVAADVAIKQFQRNHILPSEQAVIDYRREQLLPSEVAMNKVRSDRLIPAEAAIAEFNNRVLQPLEEKTLVLNTEERIPTEIDLLKFELNDMNVVKLAQEKHILNQRQPAETSLIKEQFESQRANTLDLRSDGITDISGIIGLQKENLSTDIEVKDKNIENVTKDIEIKDFNLLNRLPKEVSLLDEQIDNLEKDIEIKDYNLDNRLPKEVDLLDRQINLVTEQRESERAKTLDTRVDGTTVIKGSVGKQKDLYTQQIDSFVKDAQYKVAKLYSDTWTVQKTLDDALTAPSQFTNNEINEVLTRIRTNNNLGS